MEENRRSQRLVRKETLSKVDHEISWEIYQEIDRRICELSPDQIAYLVRIQEAIDQLRWVQSVARSIRSCTLEKG